MTTNCPLLSSPNTESRLGYPNSFLFTFCLYCWLVSKTYNRFKAYLELIEKSFRNQNALDCAFYIVKLTIVLEITFKGKNQI